MFGFIKRKRKNTPEAAATAVDTQTSTEDKPADLSHSLEKTKRTFSDGMADFLLGKKSIDSKLLKPIAYRIFP